MKKGATSLVPVMTAFGAVAAFLLVLNFAITRPNETTNANSTVTANTSDTVLANTNATVNADDTPLNTNTTTTNTNSTDEATKNWKTYTNTSLGYSVKYPPTLKVTTDSDVARFDEGDTTIFDVNYRTDSVDGSLNTWFDTSPVGDATLGGRDGKKFIYRYCDAGACGDDTVTFVVQHKSKLLGIEFSGDKEMSTTENLILSSFTFTK